MQYEDQVMRPFSRNGSVVKGTGGGSAGGETESSAGRGGEFDGDGIL